MQLHKTFGILAALQSLAASMSSLPSEDRRELMAPHVPSANDHGPDVRPEQQDTDLSAAPVRLITVTATVTAETSPQSTESPRYQWQTDGDYAGIPYKCTPFYPKKHPKWCKTYYEPILRKDFPIWDNPCSLPLFWILPSEIRPTPGDPNGAIICPPTFPPGTARTLLKDGKMDIEEIH